MKSSSVINAPILSSAVADEELIYSATWKAALGTTKITRTVLTSASHEDSQFGPNKHYSKGGCDAHYQFPTLTHQELCWEAIIPGS